MFVVKVVNLKDQSIKLRRRLNYFVSLRLVSPLQIDDTGIFECLNLLSHGGHKRAAYDHVLIVANELNLFLAPFSSSGSMEELLYIINHVFLPPKLPHADDRESANDIALCRVVLDSAKRFQASRSNSDHWESIVKMLRKFKASQKHGALPLAEVEEQLSEMADGDVLTYYIHAQNAGVIFRMVDDQVVFECFEAAVPSEQVMAAVGKLIRSFPGPAISFPSELLTDNDFCRELASFLVHMSKDVLDPAAKLPEDGGSTSTQERRVPHPRYITQLLTGILYGLEGGSSANVHRFTKRIGDDILSDRTQAPWRRSPLWLVLRVALQSSLYEGDGHAEYKSFMTFFMTGIMERAMRENLRDSSLLFCMRAKICGRIYKLGAAVPNFVVQRVEDIAGRMEGLLQKKWKAIQNSQAKSSRWDPDNLDIVTDTTLALPQSKPAAKRILQYAITVHTPSVFQAEHVPRLRKTRNFHDFTHDKLSGAFTADARIALADFEFCVQNYLDIWLIRALTDSSSSAILSVCMEEYMKAARNAYVSNPEDESIMILTLMDLWVAMDKVAVSQCPLLSEYSPEIPLDLLQPILLRKSKAFQRLGEIYRYLRQRHESVMDGSSVFDTQVTDDSFAVRYYNSPDGDGYQDLKARIERDANKERKRVIQQMKSNCVRRSNLVTEAEGLGHTKVKKIIGRGRTRREEYVHDTYACRKCQAETEVRNMKTEVYEWPLPPDNSVMEKLVLFEMVPPEVFKHWRSTTYFILHDVCIPLSSRKNERARPPVTLTSYRPLQGYVQEADGPGKVTLASLAQPLTKSNPYHAVPCSESDVCQPNALNYRLYDAVGDAWIDDPFESCDIRDLCTLRITPDGVYDDLTYAIRDTTHSSNDVIANQSDCPQGLTLHEYEAFGNLRAGPRLQWLNIARELRSRILTFSRDPVHTLLTQSAWQVGVVSDDGTLQWHQELESPDFCELLLRELDDLLGSVEANWLEGVTVRTIILLASRMLASVASTSEPAVDLAYQLLRRARGITFSWMRQLVSKLQRVEEEDVICDFQRRVFEIAATCRCTYDIDPIHLSKLLQSREDVAILVECAITIYDNAPAKLQSMSLDFQRLLKRDERLACSIEPWLCKRLGVGKNPEAGKRVAIEADGLNDAIKSIWPGYRSNLQWSLLEEPNERWITTKTIADAGQHAQDVHLNLVTGSLLINGKPLGRLPRSITAHAMYTRIFGSKILDVVPADMPGTEFACRCLISDWQVFLGLDDGRLIVRTKKDDQVLELISHHEFKRDFPKPFVEDYAHWLDLNTHEIEFRPLSSLWKPSPEHWRISSLDSVPKMSTPSLHMIDIHSPTFYMVASRLKALEDPEFIIITSPSESPNQLFHVDLPRFQLSFFLNADKALECQNLPEMLIDDNQSAGTLFGLKNYLILRSKDDYDLPRSRRILIPYGEVRYQQYQDHISISIERGSSRKVVYHEYMIDSDMGCLVSHTSLAGKLYQIYLHALSSYCLPDPLTKQTGTEEALRELQSAACFSFQSIQKEEIALLNKISTLTPRRSWASKSQTSHRVHWQIGLSTLSQHYYFSKLVGSIFQHVLAMQVFADKPDGDIDSKDPTPSHLSHRANFRLAAFYPEEFAFALSSKKRDVVHQSRDLEREDENISSNMSRMVQIGPFAPTQPPSLLTKLYEWNNIGPSDSGVDQPWAKSASSLYLDLSVGTKPSQTRVKEMILEMTVSLQESPAGELKQRATEEYDAFRSRRRLAYENLQTQQAQQLLQRLFRTWPCEEPSLSTRQAADFTMFDVATAMVKIKPYFRACYHHDRVVKVMSTAQAIINDALLNAMGETVPRYRFSPCAESHKSMASTVSLSRLFTQRDLTTAKAFMVPFRSLDLSNSTHTPPNTTELGSLIDEFQRSSDMCKKLYGKDLEQSQLSLLSQPPAPSLPASILWTVEDAEKYRDECRQSMGQALENIRETLTNCSSRNQRVLQLAGKWPRLTPRSILRRILKVEDIPESSITEYAFLYLEYQRSQRLLRAVINGNTTEFYKEERNNIVTAVNYPEWILLQVENDFICRPIQTNVAEEIIAPSSNENSVLQLNMGEGKSSVIVPMAAVALAAGDAIVRVVVLKPLANQMFQMLVQRLGGLLNRRIFYMPFSRQLDITVERIGLIRNLYTKCMETGGILVIQPEHILSFRLMCVDHLIHAPFDPDEEDVETPSAALLDLQEWIIAHSRDILDESDEILHWRYQLIYTIGQQRPLEGYPDRWTTIQQIFSLVANCALTIQQEFPLGVDIRSRDSSFPFFRITQREAGDALVASVCSKILNGQLPNYPFFSRLPIDVVQTFITQLHIGNDVARAIQDQCFETNTWRLLLMLRGLFAHGILHYVLSSRRWRVDYGLDLSRSLLAVPYRAKDVPSLLAEFGHPDVAISLTCLSYYYSGLTEGQLETCFQLLFKQDDPLSEYETWIKISRSIPAQLHHLSGVNIKDKEQWTTYLVPLFRQNHVVVDFFLSQVVFPKQAKEFPSKLSSSGWDLAERKPNVTTGFSGTNDNQYLLPTSIQQCDPLNQQSTNAKVLTYLLQPENNHYTCLHNFQNGNSPTVQEFLGLLVQEQPEVRVLLDVEAQMLELRNKQLVKHWLSLRPDLSAAVYFSESDELMVLDQRGSTEPLLLSPFKYRLDKCLVYLDQAHTRGTDLKLPLTFRAAITLGSKVTKDRLVQGAMRMRQLGQGQSVMFFAPLEIDQRIRKAAGKPESAALETIDVLRWVMIETCDDITHHVPHWAQQGLDYFRRRDAWDAFTDSCDDHLLNPWIQPEGRSLVDLYGVNAGSATTNVSLMSIPELRDRCRKIGVTFVSDSNMDEEQEREVSQEIEREQQIERPAKCKPATHTIHRHVRSFIETGTIRSNSTFVPLFRPLRGLESFRGDAWASRLLCTSDFTKTVVREDTVSVRGRFQDPSSQFLRSVNWIVSSKKGDELRLVVLSPFEVNELLPTIRTSKVVRLHVYAPRVTSTTKPFDDLQFHYFPRILSPLDVFSVDSHIVTQLNIFAGQLYVTDHSAYRMLCSFLGLHLAGETNGLPFQSDGFIMKRYRSQGGRHDISPFTKSPVPFLKELFGLRRKGNTYLSTHVGKLLHGHSLTPESFP
ncbi:hypothetical protein ARMGADRAFT_1059170 [Armillaria gallica]|uniref:ubiquitinyl hydrolase 1 n=1 Tax=Armillaria gallica TaxID=47427 RepID=A0A2H3EKN3_ARMGA|nr:hypothetical protein ARMGADRAFT_1059170 [Armillaria gallica]